MARYRQETCAFCPSRFDLIPPSDTRYSSCFNYEIDKDNIKKIYACKKNGHLNTRYWVKPAREAMLANPES